MDRLADLAQVLGLSQLGERGRQLLLDRIVGAHLLAEGRVGARQQDEYQL